MGQDQAAVETRLLWYLIGGAIYWHRQYDELFMDYVEVPYTGRELVERSTFASIRIVRTEGSKTIVSPVSDRSFGIGDITMGPIWKLNSYGDSVSLMTIGSY